MIRQFKLCVATTALLLAWIVTAAATERVALVIGNSTYKHSGNLPNPGNDAADIAVALRRIQFDVTIAHDLGFDAMRRQLREFSKKAATAKMALVYFAGHGIEVNKRNYLIPVDAELLTDKDITYEAIPLDHVVDAVNDASGLRLVLLDACRNNPFAGSMKMTSSTRSIGRGLSRIEPSAGTLVSYAAKEGTVADDGEGRNSPYTKALLAHLEQPGLEINFLFRKVRDSVLASTNQRQEPFTYGSLPARQIYLKAPVDKIADDPPPATDRGQVVWAAIGNSENIADFEFYLRQFPEDVHSNEAQASIDRLKQTGKKQPMPRADDTPVTDPALIKEVQSRLFELNYDTGTADGIVGAQTVESVKAFQADANLTADGRLTMGLVNRLREAGYLGPWGAIVFGVEQGDWGMTWAQNSRLAAVKAATASCGDGSRKCDKQLTFFNSWCGAFAYADDGWALSSRRNIKTAKTDALAGCRANAGDCRVIATVCAAGKDRFVKAE